MTIALIGGGRIGGTIATLLRNAGYTVETSTEEAGNARIIPASEAVVLAIRRRASTRSPLGITTRFPAKSSSTRPTPTPRVSPSPQLSLRSALPASGTRRAFRVRASSKRSIPCLPLNLAARAARDPRASIALAMRGDDEDAKRTVATIIAAAGYEPVDLGPLANAAQPEPAGPYYTRILSAGEMRNGELARRFVNEVLARGDMAAFDALVADDIVVTPGIAPTLLPKRRRGLSARGNAP